MMIVKSAREIEYMRRAARIVERMHARILEIIEPGKRKNEVAAEIYRTGIWGASHEGVSFGGDLDNEVWSPEIEWDLPGTEDDGVDVAGAFFRMSTWRHLPLGNGMFFQWAVRGRSPS